MWFIFQIMILFVFYALMYQIYLNQKNGCKVQDRKEKRDDLKEKKGRPLLACLVEDLRKSFF